MQRIQNRNCILSLFAFHNINNRPYLVCRLYLRIFVICLCYSIGFGSNSAFCSCSGHIWVFNIPAVFHLFGETVLSVVACVSMQLADWEWMNEQIGRWMWMWILACMYFVLCVLINLYMQSHMYVGVHLLAYSMKFSCEKWYMDGGSPVENDLNQNENGGYKLLALVPWQKFNSSMVSPTCWR